MRDRGLSYLFYEKKQVGPFLRSRISKEIDNREEDCSNT